MTESLYHLNKPISDDGCYYNNVPLCVDLGYDMITLPGAIGSTDINSAMEQLFTYNNMLYNRNNATYIQASRDQCTETLYNLRCGLWAPMCLNGRARYICREHCEGDRCWLCYSKTLNICSIKIRRLTEDDNISINQSLLRSLFI